MNKQPEITDATRNTFVEAFCELYRIKPVEKITVKEIVQKAGYSRATFYTYFHDVYDLLEYVENTFISTLMQTITCNIEKEPTLEGFVEAFTGIINEESIYIEMFMNSANRSSFIEKLQKEAVPVLTAVFGIDIDNISAKYALQFYISGIIPVLGSWLKSNREISTESLALLVKGILQDGILQQLYADDCS